MKLRSLGTAFLLLIIVAAGLALLFGNRSTTPAAEYIDPAVSTARRAAELARLDRERATGDFWTVAIPAAAVILFGLLIAFIVIRLWMMISRHNHNQRVEVTEVAAAAVLIPADERGNYPVLKTPGGVITTTPGNIPILQPQSIHYAPHYALPRHDAPPTLTSNFDASTPAHANPSRALTVPTFAELLAGREIDLTGNSILLGFNLETGQPQRGKWTDLYSTGIAGLSGSGKSTSTRFLVAQAALAGSRLMVCDPHGASGERDTLAATLAPLSDHYLIEPAITDRDIQLTLKSAIRRVTDRANGRDADRTPIVLIVDEMMHLMRQPEIATELEIALEVISQEGRKFGVFAMAISQQWKYDQIRTTTRDSFASFLVHRSRRNAVSSLLSADELREVEQLPVGQAFFYSTKGEITPLQIPFTSGQDLEQLAAQLKRARSGNEVVTSPQIDVIPASANITATEARIIDLFRADKNITEIVKEVYNVTGGAKFTSASKEVQDVLRKVIR